MKRHSLFDMSTKTDCFKTVINMKFLNSEREYWPNLAKYKTVWPNG